MNEQNALRRTLISFSIAFLVAYVAFNIQEFQRGQSKHSGGQLEANVYNKELHYVAE
jgi:hypothetical protein